MGAAEPVGMANEGAQSSKGPRPRVLLDREEELAGPRAAQLATFGATKLHAAQRSSPREVIGDFRIQRSDEEIVGRTLGPGFDDFEDRIGLVRRVVCDGEEIGGQANLTLKIDIGPAIGSNAAEFIKAVGKAGWRDDERLNGRVFGHMVQEAAGHAREFGHAD